MLVGRKQELSKLNELLAKSLAGEVTVCFITGDAGMGKSTLIYEFMRQAEEIHGDLITLSGNCNALTGKSDPYLPFMEIMAELSGKKEAKSHGGADLKNTSRLKEFARFSGAAILKCAPDLIEMFVPGGVIASKVMGYVMEETGVTNRLSQDSKKPVTELEQGQIWKQYTDMLGTLSDQSPLLLVIDDMQWADSASLELFFHLTQSLGRHRVMMVGIYRPDDITGEREGARHPLQTVIHEVKRKFGNVFIDLAVQKEEEKQAFVLSLIDLEPNHLDNDFRSAFYQRTKGYPLFAVELLQELKDREYLVKDADGYWVTVPELDWNILPSRVEGIIEERVGRLEKDLYEVLSIASVEGENFTAQVISNLKSISELDLVKMLSRQLDKQHHLIRETGAERSGRQLLSHYIFSQGLFQQYFYNELSTSERMILHSEIATVLENLYAAQQEKIALRLAYHYSMAGEAEKAIKYLLEAVRRNICLSAYVEADNLLKDAINLSTSLPEDDEGAKQILEILSLRSTVIIALKGWDSPELDELYPQMRELCIRLNEQAPLSKILFGQWAYSLVQLRLADALQTAQEYETLADKFIEARLPAYVTMGNTLFWMGEVHRAQEYMEKALQAYQPEQRQNYLVQYGQDPRVIAYQYIMPGFWMKGNAPMAQKRQDDLWQLAKELNHPFSMAGVLYTVTCQMFIEHDVAAVKDFSQRMHTLCSEHNFPFYLGLAKVFHGWAVSLSGDAAGIDEMKEGFEKWVAVYGGRIIHSIYSLMLAEGLAVAGQYDQGIAALTSGLSEAIQAQEMCYESELYRLRGELAFARNSEDPQVETDLARSLKAAQQRGQVPFQLRAALAMARYRGGETCPQDIRELLETILAQYVDGSISEDVTQAKTLLTSTGL